MEQLGLKIAMIGDSGVGKTCLIERYVRGVFNDYSESTKGAAFESKTLRTEEGGPEVKLMIWDTAGQEVYRSLTSFYIKDVDAVVIVYDITNEASYKSTEYWVEQVRDQRGFDCLIALVGNKSDCVENEKVDPEIAKEYASEIDAPYYLVSAKTGSCVNELFHNIVQKKLAQLDLSLTVRNSMMASKNEEDSFQLSPSKSESKSKKCSC